MFKRQSVRAGLIFEYLCVFEGKSVDDVCVRVCESECVSVFEG